MTNEEFEPIRIRIMQEAYELADRNDTEGYNAVKVMCSDVQRLIQREWVGLTEQDVEEVERWVEFKEEGSGRIPMGKLVRYIEAKLREKNG
jgi:hypothetical protein